jgi:L-aminopeptidase/D-esterase-like protein
MSTASITRIGHFTDPVRLTGLTVFLFDSPVPAAYCLCGASPATHELHVLEPDASVSGINGLVLTGGSAFGLGAVAGVMDYLREQGQGFRTPHGVVPIVPAAAIYDLGVGLPFAPRPEEAFEACLAAVPHNLVRGEIGAGTGATVGKLVPGLQPARGGFGRASVSLPEGVSVTACAVVNCRGDVRDAKGKIIAGARFPDGQFADGEKYLLSGQKEELFEVCPNTTLVVVLVEADFSREALHRIARVAMSGMARAISPVFTRYDGDIIFCISTGKNKASEDAVSVMAAKAVQQAIIDAVN